MKRNLIEDSLGLNNLKKRSFQELNVDVSLIVILSALVLIAFLV